MVTGVRLFVVSRSVFFRGQIERRSATSPASLLGYSDRPVVVAINTEAIHIISSDTPPVSYMVGNTPSPLHCFTSVILSTSP